ncbi:coat protein [Ustilaginoidea virens RNA virus L]|uniref:Coat protein n=1 Tax=Ustilaginoidea virens RNA virus L TaxID=1561171 RepID=A0A097I5E2_9VIRU|nr:coat protein [Ustilaginoidea virens RNA virus L]AIT56393.1 coat protein [Ustilaginoidea virens RNA virus L]
MSEINTNAFLAGILANARGGHIADNNTFRRYASSVRSSATIGGNEDARLTRIFYEVGRVHANARLALAAHASTMLRIDASYPTASVLAEEFVGLSKKYSNFAATFAYSSLAGVVERVARGLAAASLFNDVDSDTLAANQPVRVSALGTYDGPVNSMVNTVFIPRLVNSTLTGDVFAVLVNAVAGEGGSVATDTLEVNAADRRPIIGTVDAVGFPRAAVDALRLLGANMIASNQGPLFALALVRGLHKVLTVVGHTDEGGITRDLLRAQSFGVPFGGIHYGLDVYAGLPALATNSAADVASYVDSLALASAAAVAHCDPGTTYGGRWYPTFYCGASNGDAETRSGTHLAGNDEMAVNNRSQLVADLAKFSDIFIPALARIFQCGGDPAVAASILTSSGHALSKHNRHLRMATVTPFFWIEPTSILPHDAFGTRAEAEGSGALASRDQPRTKPIFEDIWTADTGDLAFSSYHVQLRNARSAWFLAHWHGHELNGLGATQVRQLDPNAIIQPGGHQVEEVRDRVESALPLSAYLWQRGQSPFCAPGEFMNLAGTMGIMVNHYTFDGDGIPRLQHLPTAREFLGATVTLTVGRPQGINDSKSNWADSQVRRARTRAARELAASAARVRAFGRPDVAAMPILTTAPPPRHAQGAQPVPARDHDVGGGVDGWRRTSVGVNDSTTAYPYGEPLGVTAHHQPVRFPQLARTLASGGTAAVPPPPPAATSSDDVSPDVPVALSPSAAPLSGPTQS